MRTSPRIIACVPIQTFAPISIELTGCLEARGWWAAAWRRQGLGQCVSAITTSWAISAKSPMTTRPFVAKIAPHDGTVVSDLDFGLRTKIEKRASVKPRVAAHAHSNRGAAAIVSESKRAMEPRPRTKANVVWNGEREPVVFEVD